MIYKKDDKFKNISLNSNNFFVMIDFDRTLTTADSLGSWNILENPKFMDPNFQAASLKLVEKYYPYELDYSLDANTKSRYMDEWFKKNMDLFFQYNLTYSILLNCVKDSKTKLRDGSKSFLKRLYDENIPVVILSAGISNVIKEFLKLNDCLFSNIHIISNFIEFEDDKMLPFSSSMIHSSNKSIDRLPINLRKQLEQKEHILLFGDLIEDLNMINKEDLSRSISFGFLENNEKENLEHYLKSFDVVLTDNSSFDIVQELIRPIWN